MRRGYTKVPKGRRESLEHATSRAVSSVGRMASASPEDLDKAHQFIRDAFEALETFSPDSAMSPLSDSQKNLVKQALQVTDEQEAKLKKTLRNISLVGRLVDLNIRFEAQNDKLIKYLYGIYDASDEVYDRTPKGRSQDSRYVRFNTVGEEKDRGEANKILALIKKNIKELGIKPESEESKKLIVFATTGLLKVPAGNLKALKETLLLAELFTKNARKEARKAAGEKKIQLQNAALNLLFSTLANSVSAALCGESLTQQVLTGIAVDKVRDGTLTFQGVEAFVKESGQGLSVEDIVNRLNGESLGAGAGAGAQPEFSIPGATIVDTSSEISDSSDNDEELIRRRTRR